MPTAGEYILVVSNGITIVLTVVGGLLTILTIWTRPALRRLVNAPLVSLGCADILYATFYSPLWIHQILNPHWEPPTALCWLMGYASPVLWGISLAHMLCIALQRYFKICTHSTRLNSTSALVVMLLLAWLVPIVSFLPLYLIEEVKVDPKLKRCALGNSDKLWAKIPPGILNLMLPYVAALVFYILIQNHVRKSKNRVQANAQGPSAGLVVQVVPVEIDSAGPSASTCITKMTKPLKDTKAIKWVGDDNSSSSHDGPIGKDCIEPGKTKGSNLVATVSGTGKQEQGKKSPSSDEKQKDNGHNEPYRAKGITLNAATVSDQEDKDERQPHVVSGGKSQNSSAAERQITKMMMILFAVYTICNLPIFLMGMFSSYVPGEAFTVGHLLASVSGALNPIVYGVMNKNIRQGYKHIWDSILNFIT
ncbi:G-protein coupled receptor 84-like [Branchiostoma floridae]|uniref:G-protein coupled receptor 84-like n=1 Tax=Branchiostoma floridae TaxID=7739 RepID=A0A9J7KIM2_BRAFL|nr:G-protein coupled receptor 84-like [Branchiostoma floridae]